MSATYGQAGVDLNAAESVVDLIAAAVQATWGDQVVGGFGGFAAGVEIPPGYTRPVLMMSTDGVGTKLDLARRYGLWSGVGQDLVAMCVDDLVAVGARPIAFTDYIAVGQIDTERERQIVTSVANACSACGCALVGGETAEHPGVMPPDHVDLAGAALGVVERGSEITGESIKPGDVVLGIESPNLRSNGYSLIRHVVGDRDLSAPFPGEDRPIGEVLLEPSVLYAPAVLAAIETGAIKGLVHVTGGGLVGNIPRVLPPGLAVELDQTSWTIPNVFAVIQEWGNIPDDEMRKVFNLGIGFVVIANPVTTGELISVFRDHGQPAQPIGLVVEGAGTVAFD